MALTPDAETGAKPRHRRHRSGSRKSRGEKKLKHGASPWVVLLIILAILVMMAAAFGLVFWFEPFGPMT